MTDQTALVAQIKAHLITQGVDLAGPCGAFEVTKRVAWALRADGAGLVWKRPEQNGCGSGDNRFSVDVIMWKSGTFADVLGTAGTDNTPTWQVKEGIDPALWRAPFDPEPATEPAIVTPPPVVTPPPAPVCNCDQAAIIAAIAASEARLSAQIEKVRSEAARSLREFIATQAGAGILSSLFGRR